MTSLRMSKVESVSFGRIVSPALNTLAKSPRAYDTGSFSLTTAVRASGAVIDSTGAWGDAEFATAIRVVFF